MSKTRIDELRNSALYSQTEAGLYLSIPLSTLRYWAIGESRKSRAVKPLIKTPDNSKQLSFLNLVELHILNSFRKNYNIDIQLFRKSLDYVKKSLKLERPLLDKNFETDGVGLFVDHYGKLIDISKRGQLAFREILQSSLKRIARDSHKIPIKLFPYTHSKQEDSPMVISMTPTLFSGRPVIDGTGISTAIISERYKAGDSVEILANDYNQPPHKIEEAIRCEFKIAA